MGNFNVHRKGAMVISESDAPPVLTVPELKRTASFAYVKLIAVFTSKFVDQEFAGTIIRIRQVSTSFAVRMLSGFRLFVQAMLQ